MVRLGLSYSMVDLVFNLHYITFEFRYCYLQKIPALAVFDRNFKDLFLHRWVSAFIFLGFLLQNLCVSLHAIWRALDSLSLTVGSKISLVRTMQGNIINLFVSLYYHIICFLSILCAVIFCVLFYFFSFFLLYTYLYSLILFFMLCLTQVI